MTDTTSDPLYRSDTRTAPSGAQQADLAPVSDQPPEHWEQQADQLATAEPEALSDPLGAQPEPASDSGSGEADREADAPSEGQAQSVANPPPAEASAPASVPTHADDGSSSMERSTFDHSGGADVDHSTRIPVAYDVEWRDMNGEHQRSGEIALDVSQATSVGADLAGAGSTQSMPYLQDTLNTADGLTAVGATTGAVQTQLASITDTVEPLGDTAFADVSTALDAATTTIDAGLDTALAQTQGLASGLASDLPLEGLDAIDPVLDTLSSDLGLGDIGLPEAPASSGGLLAALFTPVDGDVVAPAVDFSPPLADIDLGGLLGGSDDHPGLDLPGL